MAVSCACEQKRPVPWLGTSVRSGRGPGRRRWRAGLFEFCIGHGHKILALGLKARFETKKELTGFAPFPESSTPVATNSQLSSSPCKMFKIRAARLGQGEVFAEQPQSQGKDESFLNEGEIHKDQHAPRVVRDYRRRALPQEGRQVRQPHDVPVVVAVVGSQPELLPPSPAHVVLYARRRHELERALEVLVPVLRRGDRVGGVPEWLRLEQPPLDRGTVPSDVGHGRVDHGPGRREGRRGGRVAGGAGVVLQRPPGGGVVGTGRPPASGARTEGATAQGRRRGRRCATRAFSAVKAGRPDDKNFFVPSLRPRQSRMNSGDTAAAPLAPSGRVQRRDHPPQVQVHTGTLRQEPVYPGAGQGRGAVLCSRPLRPASRVLDTIHYVLGEVKTLQPSKSSYDKGNCQTNRPVNLRATQAVRSYRRRAAGLDQKYAQEVVGDGTNGQVGPFETALGEFYTGNVLPVAVGAFSEVNEDASKLITRLARLTTKTDFGNPSSGVPSGA
ncbi:hypothetical protein THAOC_03111 [Thalassiosira oceanica]|uniref:Uncharacterized protein n=1 Tax=Thalassiosira oceanica TaxID=159749 RepID=K0TCR1_THAOC|nr:hypothetical protein THAOC_03111 [Thalassiosira oceanica]|eukprot:EJK75180.1 hypothetical protein THAOC_03111 [Thalassiosira oceanica]